ncbi:MAG: NACHT domain-containing protein [Pseudonocardia sp.]
MPEWLTPRRLVILSVLVVAVFVAVALELSDDTGGADAAQLLGIPLQAVAIVVSLVCGVLALRSRPEPGDEIEEAARSLAARMRARHGRARQRMLLDRQFEADLTFEPVLGTVAPVGQLSRIVDAYAAAPDGRLVVLGRAGAGKTMLATELAVRLLERDWPEDGPGGGRVPVVLSLPTWDQGTGDPTDDELADRLDAWIVEQLVESKDVKDARTGRELVGRGRVLPILDGLDEMDAEGEPPVRAANAIRALNVMRGTRFPPAVVTGRYDEFLGILDHLAGEHHAGVRMAGVLRIRSLTVEEIEPVLTQLFPGPDGRLAPAWAELVADLRDPTSPLGAALATPWRLFLLVTTYRTEPPDVARLCALARRDEDALLADLLAGFLPAVLRSTRSAAFPAMTAAQARTWLRTMARHLRWQEGHLRLSGTDLDVPLIWLAAGMRLPRVLHAAAAVAVVCGVALAGSLLIGGPAVQVGLLGRFIQDPSVAGLFAALFPIFAIVVTIGAASQAWRLRLSLGEIDLRMLGSRATWRRAARGIARDLWLDLTVGAVLFAIGWWLLGSLTAAAVLGGAAAGISLLNNVTSEITYRATRLPERLRHPSDLVRGEFVSGAFTGLVIGVPLVAVCYLLGGAAVVPIALLGTVWFVLPNCDTGVRYVIAVGLLSARGAVPRRFGRFLDWAYEAGVLGLTGIAVQFRHLELRDWLTAEPTEPADRGEPTDRSKPDEPAGAPGPTGSGPLTGAPSSTGP